MTRDAERLDQLQRDAFQYFLQESNPANGLVRDNTQAGSPASIAAIGLALATYRWAACVAISRAPKSQPGP